MHVFNQKPKSQMINNKTLVSKTPKLNILETKSLLIIPTGLVLNWSSLLWFLLSIRLFLGDFLAEESPPAHGKQPMPIDWLIERSHNWNYRVVDCCWMMITRVEIDEKWWEIDRNRSNWWVFCCVKTHNFRRLRWTGF